MSPKAYDSAIQPSFNYIFLNHKNHEKKIYIYLDQRVVSHVRSSFDQKAFSPKRKTLRPWDDFMVDIDDHDDADHDKPLKSCVCVFFLFF